MMLFIDNKNYKFYKYNIIQIYKVEMKKKVGKYILHLDDILGKGNFGKVVRAVQANTEN